MEFLTLIVPLLIAIGIFSLRQYQFQKRRKQRTDYYRNVYLKSDAWERKRFVVFRRYAYGLIKIRFWQCPGTCTKAETCVICYIYNIPC